MALEGTIKTPFGPVQKKTAAIVGAGGGLVLGIVWYRSRQAGANASSSSGQSATDASTSDPASGFAYGSPEEAAFLAQQGGYVDTSGVGATPGYASSLPPVAPVPIPNSGPGTFTSNGQWSQYAEQYLVDTAQADPVATGNALGKYITGQPLTVDQQSIVQQAIAFAGYPPVNGPGGNPPGMATVPNPPTGGGGGGGGGTKPAVPKGLRVTHHSRTGVNVSCNAVTGATEYVFKIRGGTIQRIQGDNNTSHFFGDLHPGTSYTISVAAKNAAGQSAFSGGVSVRTDR